MSTLRVNNIQNVSETPLMEFSSGTIVLPAGSETRAPMRFTAGPGLTTPVAGSLEYNGTSFLTTSSSVSGRAFNDDSLLYVLDTDRTIVATVVAGTWYSILGQGITLPASSAYVFDIMVGLRTGTTSHTVSFSFQGTATYTFLQYRTEFTNLALSTGAAAPGTPTAAVTLMYTGNPSSAANGVISPASILATKFFRVHGVFETNASGTVIPSIAFSANPTGTNQVTRLSYARFNSFGTFSGDLKSGNWV
jgi:hypothetical protein